MNNAQSEEGCRSGNTGERHRLLSYQKSLGLRTRDARSQLELYVAVVSDNDSAKWSGVVLPANELVRLVMESALPDIVAERRKTAFNMRMFSQTRTEGSVRLNGKNILLFQTPFDSGWHGFIDGRATPTFKVDTGLLGIALEEGEHSLALRYRPPMQNAGVAVTVVSCCIFFFSLLRWPRIHLTS
jgi:hypothetical protein